MVNAQIGACDRSEATLTPFVLATLSRALTVEAMAGRFHGDDERIDVEALALTTQAWLDACELFLG